MNRRFIFGNFREKESIIHKVDPRLKLIYLIVLSILIFTLNSKNEILMFSFSMFAVIILSRIKFMEFVSGLMPFYFMFIFIMSMYLIFSPDKMEAGYLSLYRFLMLLSASFVLTYTSKIPDLVFSIEKLAKPLKVFGIKPRNIALMVSIAIRFIPIMIISMQKTKDAMSSRLANFRKIRIIKQFMLVLLEKMIKSASNMADALQARLYDENIEIKKSRNFRMADYFSAVIMIIFLLVI